MRILFDSKLSQFKTPFGTLKRQEVCTLHIMIPCSCRTTAVCLVLQAENGAELRRVPFAKQSDDTLYDTWGGELTISDAGLYFYYFHITTQDGAFRLFKQGESDTNMEDGGLWQLSVLEEKFPVPDDCAGAIMYQIFPDRFFQAGVCDLTGKITPYWVHENKDDVPVYLPNANGEVLNNDFYGGNLNGIREKLPYLHALGVEILYLNPIFYAWSTHRYDTCDYKRIDPMLGSEADFRALCGAAHALGMKIILDGVFSHVGSRSAYFQQAIHDPASPYRGWFRFKQYPNVYDSWWGITTLPCIDKLNPDYMDYIIDSDDSVVVRWLKLGADGWRLDVVDELPDAFLARLRERIRQVKPDAILIGEVWEDASNKEAYGVKRRYLLGDQLDSVMNYPFREAIIAYMKGEAATTFRDRIMVILENYPKCTVDVLMNFVSTHDIERAINRFGGQPCDDKSKDWMASNELSPDEYNRGKALLKGAMVLQFFLPGVPSIYYGDEAGLQGWKDPFNRRCYPWGNEDTELVEYTRQMAKIRREHPAFAEGAMEFLVLEEKVLGFARYILQNGSSAVVLMNRSDETAMVSLRDKCFEKYAFSTVISGICDGDAVILPAHSYAVVSAVRSNQAKTQ